MSSLLFVLGGGHRRVLDAVQFLEVIQQWLHRLDPGIWAVSVEKLADEADLDACVIRELFKAASTDFGQLFLQIGRNLHVYGCPNTDFGTSIAYR